MVFKDKCYADYNILNPALDQNISVVIKIDVIGRD